jgi:hypothetical protein
LGTCVLQASLTKIVSHTEPSQEVA